MTHASTSIEALARVRPALNLMQLEVLEFIQSRQAGCTDLDIQNHFNNHRSTYRTRRSELVEQSLVIDSGRTIKQDGGKRTIWIAA